MIYYREVHSLDLNRVISELASAGVLPKDTVGYAESILGSKPGDRKHEKAGMADWTRSPYLVEWLASRSLEKPRCVVFLCSVSRHPTVWHKDGPASLCALNIPWFGTEHTATEWTDDSNLEPTVIQGLDNNIVRIEGRGPKGALESAVLHGKCLAVDTAAYHRVVSSSDSGYRGILSIRFHGMDFQTLRSLVL